MSDLCRWLCKAHPDVGKLGVKSITVLSDGRVMITHPTHDVTIVCGGE